MCHRIVIRRGRGRRIRLVVRLALAALLFAGVARAGSDVPFQPSLPDSVMPRLGAIREECRLLDEQIARSASVARPGESPAWQPIFRGHDELLSRGTLDFLRGLQAASTDSTTSRLLARLEYHLASLTIRSRVAALDDAAEGLRSRVQIEPAGFSKPMTLNELNQALTVEPDSARGASLRSARADHWRQKLTPLFTARRRMVDSLSVALGYPGYLGIAEGLRAARLAPLLAELFPVLRISDRMYQTLLHEVTGIPSTPERINAPVARLVLDGALDARPFDRLVRPPAATLDDFRRGLGLGDPLYEADLNAVGVAATEARLRAAGAAWYRARPSRPAREFRELEPDAPARAAGELLGAALFDSSRVADAAAWAPSSTERERVRAARQALLREIYRVRRGAALLLYEVVASHGADSLWTPYLYLPEHPDPALVYREVLGFAGAAMLAAPDVPDFAAAGQGFLDPADDLRAMALAAIQADRLRAGFGPRWYASAAAGAWVRATLWDGVNDRDLDALAGACGARSFSFEALWHRWTRTFEWTEARLAELGD